MVGTDDQAGTAGPVTKFAGSKEGLLPNKSIVCPVLNDVLKCPLSATIHSNPETGGVHGPEVCNVLLEGDLLISTECLLLKRCVPKLAPSLMSW